MANHRSALLCLVAVVVVTLVGIPGLAEARSRYRIRYEEVSEFAVEFTCGVNDASSGRIVPGEYATVINVHNAGVETKARAMVSLSFPTSNTSDWLRTTFAPMQSRQIDCADILGGGFVFEVPLDENGYYQGFVIIQSKGSLDVVARYTAAGSDGEVTTDVETVTARRVKRPQINEDELVTMCHLPPGNPDNAHTVEVGAAAVAAHIGHGDYQGECSNEDEQ